MSPKPRATRRALAIAIGLAVVCGACGGAHRAVPGTTGAAPGTVAATTVAATPGSSADPTTAAGPSTTPTTPVPPPPTSATILGGPENTVAAATTTTTTTTTTTSTTDGGGGPATTVATPPGLDPCPSSALVAGIEGPDGSAGSLEYLLRLDNVGPVACTVRGFAGVSAVAGAAGAQVGAAAARDAGAEPTVVLAVGRAATAVLTATDPGVFPAPSCRPATAAGLRVYPPGDRSALYVPVRLRTCADAGTVTLGIGPFQAVATG